MVVTFMIDSTEHPPVRVPIIHFLREGLTPGDPGTIVFVDNCSSVGPEMISSSDEELEDLLDVLSAQEALKELEKEGTVSWEDLKAELGL